MKYIALATKTLCDLALIIVWFYIIANRIHFNFWLVAISILFWFAYDATDYIKSKKEVVE